MVFEPLIHGRTRNALAYLVQPTGMIELADGRQPGRG
jgi:hypothetical protein